MKILIMRHGEAEHFCSMDENRELTEYGIDQSNYVAQRCLQKGIHHFDCVLISPYLRAQQTWKAIEHHFSADLVEICEDITPYGDSFDVHQYLQALLKTQMPNTESLLLISHLPLVGYLVAEFIEGQTPPIFLTSTVACIEFDPITNKGALEWIIKP